MARLAVRISKCAVQTFVLHGRNNLFDAFSTRTPFLNATRSITTTQCLRSGKSSILLHFCKVELAVLGNVLFARRNFAVVQYVPNRTHSLSHYITFSPRMWDRCKVNTRGDIFEMFYVKICRNTQKVRNIFRIFTLRSFSFNIFAHHGVTREIDLCEITYHFIWKSTLLHCKEK